MRNTKDNDTYHFGMIERWKTSKQTKTEFCKKENIRYHVFYYWHKKHQRIHRSVNTQTTPSFIKLPNISTVPSVSYCEIHFANGIRLSFNTCPDASFLKSLL